MSPGSDECDAMDGDAGCFQRPGHDGPHCFTSEQHMAEKRIAVQVGSQPATTTTAVCTRCKMLETEIELLRAVIARLRRRIGRTGTLSRSEVHEVVTDSSVGADGGDK